eukprot:477960-Prorocentrum_minimum.AAC.1
MGERQLATPSVHTDRCTLFVYPCEHPTGVMFMLLGVIDRCNLNTGTVLGNWVMASCSRV